MNDYDMTEERFKQIVSSYGANPEFWPAHEVHAAQNFMAKHDMRDVLETERQLDALLADATAATATTGPSDLLSARILKQAAASAAPEQVTPKMSAPSFFQDNTRTWQSIAATLVLSLAVGLGIGEFNPIDQTDEEDVTLILLTQTYANDDTMLGWQ